MELYVDACVCLAASINENVSFYIYCTYACRGAVIHWNKFKIAYKNRGICMNYVCCHNAIRILVTCRL